MLDFHTLDTENHLSATYRFSIMICFQPIYLCCCDNFQQTPSSKQILGWTVCELGVLLKALVDPVVVDPGGYFIALLVCPVTDNQGLGVTLRSASLGCIGCQIYARSP